MLPSLLAYIDKTWKDPAADVNVEEQNPNHE
jgi:hypothetical protein